MEGSVEIQDVVIFSYGCSKLLAMDGHELWSHRDSGGSSCYTRAAHNLPVFVIPLQPM